MSKIFLLYLMNSVRAKKNSSRISPRMTQAGHKYQFTVFGICCIDVRFFWGGFRFFLLLECHQAQGKMPLAIPHSFRQWFALSAEFVMVLSLGNWLEKSSVPSAM